MEECAKQSMKKKPIGPKDNSEQPVDLVTPTLCGVTRNRPLEAARASAERRWSQELNYQYSATPEIYGKIIDAIDLQIQSAATEAEMKRRGGGLAYILNQLMAEKYRGGLEG